jgi:hypothetical protein
MTIAFNPPFSLMNEMVAGSMNATKSQSTLPCGVCKRMARSPIPNCLRVVVELARLAGSSASERGLVVM